MPEKEKNFTRVVFNCAPKNYAKLQDLVTIGEAKHITDAINLCIRAYATVLTDRDKAKLGLQDP